MPKTRSFGKPDDSAARYVISSSGFDTTIDDRVGRAGRDLRDHVEFMIAAFLPSRSMRLMPGWRGNPAVITTMSLPAVSA